jgi:hypothetical protein
MNTHHFTIKSGMCKDPRLVTILSVIREKLIYKNKHNLTIKSGMCKRVILGCLTVLVEYRVLTDACPEGWCNMILELGRECLIPSVPAHSNSEAILDACPTHHVAIGDCINCIVS